MWGGCGEGSCLRGWRVQWQSKGEERKVVSGDNAKFAQESFRVMSNHIHNLFLGKP